jgi:hypothetical protein
MNVEQSIHGPRRRLLLYTAQHRGRNPAITEQTGTESKLDSGRTDIPLCH